MNEENQNQPPLETESAAPEQRETGLPEQRRHRPRRRFPRRRYYNRDDRSENLNDSHNENSAPAGVDPATGEAAAELLDRQSTAAVATGEQGQAEPEFGEGIIEISGKGFGFLRDPKRNFVQAPQDIFVTPEIVRRFALRDGMWIYGETRRGNRGRPSRFSDCRCPIATPPRRDI